MNEARPLATRQFDDMYSSSPPTAFLWRSSASSGATSEAFHGRAPAPARRKNSACA